MSEEKKDFELFAAHLKTIRQVLGLTQDELALKVGVARQTISSIENGSMALSKPVFLALLSLFMVATTANPILQTVLSSLGFFKMHEKYFSFKNIKKKVGD